MRKELSKVYEPQEVEGRIYQQWEENKCFAGIRDAKKKPYTIVMPPPNVTGQLHMGHAMDCTLQDILIRFKRMQGYAALWVPGTDHAGIATQIKVEEELRKSEGLTRYDLGREKFLERVWDWKHKFGNRIVEQQKKLGASCDWSRARFTMDEGLSNAVRHVFVSLYNKGLIYKGSRIINWCPHCVTALSDAEVEYKEKPGHLWHIRYPIAGEEGRYVTVATTRPETMLGDTGVAVNPEDGRYRDIVGKKCILPLVNKEIPIVADAYVDMEFGTGCVKMTPAHDPNDFEVGLRHNLESIRVLDDNGKVVEGYGRYSGMDRYEARKAIVADLEEQGYLVKVEEHTHNVGTCYRCGTDVEPIISAQWFVKMEPLAREALRVVNDGGGQVRPRPLLQDLHQLDGERPRLVHLPPALVGPPHPRLDVRGLRRDDRQRDRSHRVPALPLHPHPPGGGCAGHLVLLRPVALLHPGLARREQRGLQVLLSHRCAGHRLRHHLLLGGPDDLLRLRADQEAPLPHRVHPRPGAGRQGKEDVQEPGQRHRPPGDRRQVRRRRPALQPGHRQQPRQRHALLHRAV